MSKLHSAPLIEVIFELRWPGETVEAQKSYSYVPGELYGVLKDNYPVREALPASIIPPLQSLGVVGHRFREKKNGHPLVQLGPGILTINTTDSTYEWEDFEGRILNVSAKFLDIHPFDPETSLFLNLVYFDFIPFNFQENDVLDFLQKNMHVSLNQAFLTTKQSPKQIRVDFQYQTEDGVFALSIQHAVHLEQEGMILQFSMSQPVLAKPKEISEWLHSAHKACSQAFKDLTKGSLYTSFNQPQS